MTRKPTEFDPETIVEQLYDIAMDPETLGKFISAWNDAGLDASEARQSIDSIDRFDQEYQAHLKRAETFLKRGGDDTGLDLTATLTPFDNLAAFIIDASFKVVACNDGAKQSFGILEGAQLEALHLSGDAQQALHENLQSVFVDPERPLRLVKVETETGTGPALFQIRLMAVTPQQPTPLALVVTTQYHWQETLGKTLEEVFSLTAAEQGVVRALVEGMSAKSISAERGTSEGTVRGQIKSIQAKMNARSQSEVIRLVLSLRDISEGTRPSSDMATDDPVLKTDNWLEAEVWKPLKTLILPDGRKMEYQDMGPVTGTPILYSHMGYCLVRWHEPMLKLAFKHGLRIICPIRAGFGYSDNIDPKADVVETTRYDTLFLLDHLKIKRVPYAVQGNDLIFAADLAAHHPERISEIIGICGRPSIKDDLHYAGLGKWHRFFLSTARHAPHLLNFTVKAGVSMAKRIGGVELLRRTNNGSPADMALLEDPEVATVLRACGEMVIGKKTNISQAYAMEVLATESPWSDKMNGARGTKTTFINGAEDPNADMVAIARYREDYPWIDIEVVPNAGQLMIFQCYEMLIPRFAAAARKAAS